MKEALAGNADGESPQAMAIVQEIRETIQIFMIRRAFKSEMFG